MNSLEDSRFAALNYLDFSVNGDVTICVLEKGHAEELRNVELSDDKVESFRSITCTDGVLLSSRLASRGVELQICRTANMSTPLYVSIEPDRVILSWDFWYVVDNRGHIALNKDLCQRFAVEGPSLYNETIIEGMFLLGPSQVLIVDGTHHQLVDGFSPKRFHPSPLAVGASASTHFLELIADQIRPLGSQNLNISAEVSGGYDSACVAGACRMASLGLQTSYSLLQSGVAGSQQSSRRKELVDYLGTSDVEISASLCKPLSRFRDQHNERYVPYDEIYRRGIQLCIDRCSPKPDIILTGIGGDELTLPFVESGPEREPLPHYDSQVLQAARVLTGKEITPKIEFPTFASASSIVSAVCRADTFLNNGIWPKNPLVEPKIVRFCDLLPNQFRDRRLINMLCLARMGMSDYFIIRRHRENFGQIYREDLRNTNIEEILYASYIGNFKIISVSALVRQHDKFLNTDVCDIPLTTFANSFRLERIICKIAKITHLKGYELTCL